MLDEVPWMDNQNKEKSKTKALNMEDFIGYPEKLLTENLYPDLEIRELEFFGNVLRIKKQLKLNS